MTEATTKPANENVSVVSVTLSHAPPMQPGRAEQNQQVEAEHRRRQHQRHGDDGFDDRAGSAARESEPPRERRGDDEQHEDGDGRELQAEPYRSELEFRHLNRPRSWRTM